MKDKNITSEEKWSHDVKKNTLQNSNFKNKPSRMQTKLNHEKGQK